MSSASSSRQQLSTVSRKPKRMYRYLEGFLSEQEQEEQERQLSAAANIGMNSEEGASIAESSTGKRVKTAKACLFCKRSHMSCEIERPCSRCITRGIGERCCDTEEQLAELVKSASGRTTQHDTQADPFNVNTSKIENDLHKDSNDPSFDVILTFLGNMQAATDEWGPVPSSSVAISPQNAFDQPSWIAGMTPSNDAADAAAQIAGVDQQSAALHFLADNAISPFPSAGPIAETPRSGLTTNQIAKNLEDVNKPFVSGSLPFYAAEDDRTTSPSSPPWKHIMHADWTSSASLEDSIVRPYQYAYGYTRIERWIRSPLSGWSEESASTVKAVLDKTRPLLRQRWAVLSDLQLVQHEERHEAVVAHYRHQICEAIPVPLVVVRRTFEIVCANRAFAKLCDTQRSVFNSGRICLYQLLEQSFVVDIFRRLEELIDRGERADRDPIRLQGRVKFTCSSSALAKANGVVDSSTIALRHVNRIVSLSLEAVVDEHGLPLCFVCTLTPMQEKGMMG